jgi:hypothetical protein
MALAAIRSRIARGCYSLPLRQLSTCAPITSRLALHRQPVCRTFISCGSCARCNTMCWRSREFSSVAHPHTDTDSRALLDVPAQDVPDAETRFKRDHLRTLLAASPPTALNEIESAATQLPAAQWTLTLLNAFLKYFQWTPGAELSLQTLLRVTADGCIPLRWKSCYLLVRCIACDPQPHWSQRLETLRSHMLKRAAPLRFDAAGYKLWLSVVKRWPEATATLLRWAKEDEVWKDPPAHQPTTFLRATSDHAHKPLPVSTSQPSTLSTSSPSPFTIQAASSVASRSTVDLISAFRKLREGVSAAPLPVPSQVAETVVTPHMSSSSEHKTGIILALQEEIARSAQVALENRSTIADQTSRLQALQDQITALTQVIETKFAALTAPVVPKSEQQPSLLSSHARAGNRSVGKQQKLTKVSGVKRSTVEGPGASPEKEITLAGELAFRLRTLIRANGSSTDLDRMLSQFEDGAWNTRSLQSLLRYYINSPNAAAALSHFDRVVALGHAPSSLTFSLLIRALAKDWQPDHLQQLCELREKMLAQQPPLHFALEHFSNMLPLMPADSEAASLLQRWKREDRKAQLTQAGSSSSQRATSATRDISHASVSPRARSVSVQPNVSQRSVAPLLPEPHPKHNSVKASNLSRTDQLQVLLGNASPKRAKSVPPSQKAGTRVEVKTKAEVTRKPSGLNPDAPMLGTTSVAMQPSSQLNPPTTSVSSSSPPAVSPPRDLSSSEQLLARLQLLSDVGVVELSRLEKLATEFPPAAWTVPALHSLLTCLTATPGSTLAWSTFQRLTDISNSNGTTSLRPDSTTYALLSCCLARDWQPAHAATLDSLRQRMRACQPPLRFATSHIGLMLPLMQRQRAAVTRLAQWAKEDGSLDDASLLLRMSLTEAVQAASERHAGPAASLAAATADPQLAVTQRARSVKPVSAALVPSAAESSSLRALRNLLSSTALSTASATSEMRSER